ncbi:unnamed protein product [Durusdinium trenchii]|uniref:Uncharacterized protein n=1 Tax=Durusdinium trenchii TaxID=1381693 RepID=A0ABP0HRK2_9DINO
MTSKEASDFTKDWPELQLKASSADYYFESYNHYGVHEDIFQDGVTIQAFQQAILQNSHMFEGKVVLEVSSGLGLCSLWAAKAGARKVIALETHEELVELSRRAAELNGYSEVIDVVCGKPSSIKQLPGGVEAVDIIVCVFMGFFLLYEARLEELLDARDKWLKPGGLMFPDRAKLFVSLLQDADYKRKHYDYYDEVWGFDFSCMKEAAKAEPALLDCDEVYVKASLLLVAMPFAPSSVLASLISSITSVLNLDLLHCSVADCYNMASKFKLRCRHEGSLDAMVFWFEVWFGACHKPICFSTGPESTQTCWKQTVFFLQGTTRRVKAGDEVHCMLALRKLLKERRHLDIKIACKVNTGSQQVNYFRWM